MIGKSVRTLRSVFIVLLALALLLPATSVTFAQEVGAEDEGVVEEGPVLPAVEVVDAEDNILGEVDFTLTPAGRLFVEVTAEGFDPTQQQLAIADDPAVCEGPDFGPTDNVLLDLSQFRFFQDQELFVQETPVEGGVLEEEAAADELADADEQGIVTVDATLEELTGNAEGFAGEIVQVDGELEDIISPTAFTLESDELIRNEVLILSANEAGFGLVLEEFEDEEVEVTGEVFVFNVADLEAELGFELDADTLAPFDGETAIVARDVDPLGGAAEPAAEAVGANEFFAVVGEFDREAILDENGAALIVREGLEPTSPIVGCAVIEPAEAAAEVPVEVARRGPTLGILARNVTPDIAEEGVLVQRVEADTPAATAGLEAGDVIVGFNGTPVANIADLRAELADVQPGDEVTLTVLRDGEEQEIRVTFPEVEE